MDVAHYAVVTETYPPEINGVALTLGHLVRGLRARGHVITVIRPRQHAADHSHGLDDPTVALVGGMPLPRYAGLQVGMPAAALLRGRWSRQRPDAVYVATEGPLGYSAVTAARRLGIAVFSGFHTNFHRYATHYRAAWLRRALIAYLRRFHNRTDGTLVATSELRDRLAAQGFANLGVLGRGVDTRLFNPGRRSASLRAAWGASERDLVVLHVGRLAAEKNVALAIGAYRAMQAHRSSLRFVLVGDGPLRLELQRAHPDLIFPGVRRDESLAEHYASADVFLFPSETETFGNVTLEALASGLGVVAYDYAAAGQHIRDGDSGVLVTPGDGAAFAAAAAGLARSPDALARVRRHARDAVADADWRRVAARFEVILSGSMEARDGGFALARGEGR